MVGIVGMAAIWCAMGNMAGHREWVYSRGKGATCKEYWRGMAGVVRNGEEKQHGDYWWVWMGLAANNGGVGMAGMAGNGGNGVDG